MKRCVSDNKVRISESQIIRAILYMNFESFPTFNFNPTKRDKAFKVTLELLCVM